MEVIQNKGPHGSLELAADLALNRRPSLLLLDPRVDASIRAELLSVVSGAEYRPEFVWIASSGTTQVVGVPPTLVALSWQALCAGAQAVNEHLQVTERDIWLLALPDFHVGGFGIRVRSLLTGSKLIATAGNRAPWNGSAYFSDLIASQATLTSLVPTQLYDLVQEHLTPPPALRAAVIGGQALAPALYFRARELGWPILPSYGMTEACSQIATADISSLGERGIPKLKRLSHIECGATPDGFLTIDSPALLEGTLARSFDGWQFAKISKSVPFVTSDRGEVQGDFLLVLGRGSDQVKIGGEFVNRTLLEQTLIEVRLALNYKPDMALHFEPDERLGFEVVLLSTDALAGALVEGEFNRRVLAPGRIRSVKQVDAIQRDVLGKRAKLLN